MRKPIGALLIIVLLMSLPVNALASDWDWGGIEGGGMADANRPYGFLPEDTQVAENGELSWQWLDELYTGSAIYIPIGKEDDTQATEKDIKNDKVALSWKATMGGGYIRDVTIVDGKKEKITDLPAGAYAKIQLAGSLDSMDRVKGQAKLVLSINNVSYRETEIQVDFTMENRIQYIDANTVYGAALPTLFEVETRYGGEATFDMGGGVQYTAQVKPGERYLLNYSNQPDEAQMAEIKERFPSAYVEFHDFKGSGDTFPQSGRLEIPVDAKNFSSLAGGVPEVYWYDLEGKMLDSYYDKQGGKVVILTRSLSKYVLSDTDLRQSETTGSPGYEAPAQAPDTAVPAPDTNIPPTGGDTQPVTAVAQQAAGAEPVVTNLSTGINADNKAGENPLTGAPLLPVGAAAVVAFGAGAVLWRLRPVKKKK